MHGATIKIIYKDFLSFYKCKRIFSFLKQHNLLLYTVSLLYSFTVLYIDIKLKLIGTYQLHVYAEDVNILGGSVYTIKKNAAAVVVASKEIGLEVNADKTKNMVMSREQNAGRIHRAQCDY